MQTWLHDRCCLFWDARLKRRFGCATIVVSFGTRDSEEELAVQLLFCLGKRDSEEDLAV